MAQSTCSVEGCAKVRTSRGWCHMHYTRWRRAERPTPRIVTKWGMASCGFCGTPFQKKREGNLFCSERCYDRSRSSNPSPLDAPRRNKTEVGRRFIPVGESLALGDLVSARVAMRQALQGMSVAASSGCWIWSERADGNYPCTVSIGGRHSSVHRHVVEIMHGTSLEGMHAHHICGRSLCVQPDHLTAATSAANQAEMLARKSYRGRIEALERALSEFDPNHPLLGHPQIG